MGIPARDQGGEPPKTLVHEVAAPSPGCASSSSTPTNRRPMSAQGASGPWLARAGPSSGSPAGPPPADSGPPRRSGRWPAGSSPVTTGTATTAGRCATARPASSSIPCLRAGAGLRGPERAFRELTDVIELRPIYLRRKERVQAHLFVAALAFLLDRAHEKRLQAARVAMSAAGRAGLDRGTLSSWRGTARHAQSEPIRRPVDPGRDETLAARVRRYTSPYRDVIRAKIVLLAAQGLANDVIAARLDTPRQIVSKWRQRFCTDRLPGLAEQPRGGRPARLAPQRRRRGQSPRG